MSENLWVTEPLKNFIIDMNDGGTPPREAPENFNGGIPWVVISDIKREIWKTRESLSVKGLAACSARLWPENTIILSTGATIGNIGIAKDSMSTKQGITGLIPNARVLPDFLYYELLFLKQKIIAWAQGSTFAEIRTPILGKLPLKIPLETKVQRKIAIVLNTVDQAIEKTEEIIEKYQHIKAGLMHDLFTRGIGANGKLRPPREEAPELYQETAIGWIPKEWKLDKLGELTDICSGVTLGAKKMSVQTIKVPYLRVANVQDGYFDLQDVKEIHVNQSTYDKLLLRNGDVLMNEGGDYDKLGRGAVWRCEVEPCIHQNHVFRVRVNSPKLRYLYLALYSQSNFGKKYFILNSKQSTNLASINSTQLKKFPIAMPTPSEQQKIEEKLHGVNHKIMQLEFESSKLQKQKSGLMHDLLTGKVEVSVTSVDTANV